MHLTSRVPYASCGQQEQRGDATAEWRAWQRRAWQSGDATWHNGDATWPEQEHKQEHEKEHELAPALPYALPCSDHVGAGVSAAPSSVGLGAPG